MNVYKISYQAALNGEYRKRAQHTAWDNYLESGGARIGRSYGDPELDLSSDHLQNIVNLVYSGRKQGVDEIRITLDHQQAQEDAIRHFYALLFLPEVKARFAQDKKLLVLQVTFEARINTSSFRTANPSLDDIPDFDTVWNVVERRSANEKMRPFYERDPFSFGIEALGEATKTDSRRKVELPQWIIEKYELSEDDADSSKGMADALTGLAQLFH